MILWGKFTSKCSCLLNNNDVAFLSRSISLQKGVRKVSKQKEIEWKNFSIFYKQRSSYKNPCKFFKLLLAFLKWTKYSKPELFLMFINSEVPKYPLWSWWHSVMLHGNWNVPREGSDISRSKVCAAPSLFSAAQLPAPLAKLNSGRTPLALLRK